MKNIHVLPTDEPSRLFELSGSLHLHTELGFDHKRSRNIYITNDEEIKGVDWCLLDHNVGQSTGYSILKCLESDVENGEYTFKDKDGDIFTTGRCKKIILTTDQDLIKGGVQAIDDKFLEWFIKNPSCEEVEVRYSYPTIDDEGDGSISKGYWLLIISEENKIYRECPNGCRGKLSYLDKEECLCSCGTKWNIKTNKIIIPKEDLGYTTKSGIKVSDEMVRATMIPKEYFGKEEPKQDWFCPKCDSYVSAESVTFEETHQTCNTGVVIKEPKQETLEEDAFNFTANKSIKEIQSRMDFVKGAVFGAKWQQEKSYSDMQEYAEYSIECFRLGEDCLFAKEWFEQFKKK